MLISENQSQSIVSILQKKNKKLKNIIEWIKIIWNQMSFMIILITEHI